MHNIHILCILLGVEYYSRVREYGYNFSMHVHTPGFLRSRFPAPPSARHFYSGPGPGPPPLLVKARKKELQVTQKRRFVLFWIPQILQIILDQAKCYLLYAFTPGLPYNTY